MDIIVPFLFLIKLHLYRDCFEEAPPLSMEERMRKLAYKIRGCILALSFLGLTGCSEDSDKLIADQQMEMPPAVENVIMEESSTGDVSNIEESPADEVQEVIVKPVIEEMNWPIHGVLHVQPLR